MNTTPFLQTPNPLPSAKAIIASTQSAGSSSAFATPKPVVQPTPTPTVQPNMQQTGLINGVDQATYNRLDNLFKTPATPTAPIIPPLAVNPVNPVTGGVPSTNLSGITKADVLSTRNYLQELQDKIIQNTMLSPSEIQARQNIADVGQQQLEAKQASEAEIDRLMSSSNLTREQAGGFLTEVNRRAQNNATQLALQQSANSNVLGKAQALRENDLKTFATLYGLQQPVAVGGNLVNPNTGEVVYRGGDGFSLSEGQSRYDAQGNLIAGGGTMGGGLLSVSEATQLGVPYGTTRDQAFGLSPANTKALSGEASKLLSITETVQPEIEALKQAFSNNYKKSLFGITTGTDRELVKLVDQVADKVGRLRSGGAINTDEATRFKNQIASFMDIPFGNSQQAINALDGILAEAKSVATSIRGSGVMNNQTSNNIVQTRAGAINVNW